MSREIFSITLQKPSTGEYSVTKGEIMTSLEIERMTYDLKKKLQEAHESYNEDAVLAVIQDTISDIEERFDIKFLGYRVKLANNRTRNVESDVQIPERSDIL